MDAMVTPAGVAPIPGSISLSMLSPGTTATVRTVGTQGAFTPLERRLIELGFVAGEQVEVIAQASPGGDPFVVRIGQTTFAVRRREVETVWVEVAPAAAK